MLSLKKVKAFYNKTQVLYDIDLEVNKGEIVTLIGSNGAGKTTTINTISGIVKREGEIKFGDVHLDKLSAEKIVQIGIIQVPEGRKVFPGLTVKENLEIGAVTRKVKAKTITLDMEEIFEMFPRLKERINQLSWSLSGGEQQMLVIGRALMAKPKVILFDEPSLGLAPILVDSVFESIVKLNQEMDVSVLLVEQNAYMALNISNRGYILENGAIKIFGKSKDLLNNSKLKEAYLGINNG